MKTDPNSFQTQGKTHEQLFGTPDGFHVITENAVLANVDEINFINSVFSISHSRSTYNSSDPVTHMIPVLYTTYPVACMLIVIYLIPAALKET